MLEFMDCWSPRPNANGSNIINPVDLNRINERVESKDYNSLDEFVVDIEWIHHNCHVYFSGEWKRRVCCDKNNPIS